MISLIAAVANQGAMSYQGQLPWRMPADLPLFQENDPWQAGDHGTQNL